MAHKLLLFMKRKPGMSMADFRDYYENKHIPLCMKYMGGISRYFRRYVDQQGGEPELDFDVITELWFDDAATRQIVMETLDRDGMPDEVIEDEKNVFDRSKARYCTMDEAETDLAG